MRVCVCVCVCVCVYVAMVDLTVSNLRELLDLTWDYRARWRFIGIQLGIDAGTLDAINVNHKTVEECLSDMLKQWLNGTECTKSALDKALLSPQVASEGQDRNGTGMYCKTRI